MNPHEFPECNIRFGPPKDLAESQCMTIPAYQGTVSGGSVDGCQQVVVAWLPTSEEIKAIQQGEPIFISFIGGLPPHYPSMSFFEATHPS